MCMNNEISPFSGFALSHYVHTTYIFVQIVSFELCGIMFSLFCAHVIWQNVERAIHVLNCDR